MNIAHTEGRKEHVARRRDSPAQKIHPRSVFWNPSSPISTVVKEIPIKNGVQNLEGTVVDETVA